MFGFLCPIPGGVSSADAQVFAEHQDAVAAALRAGYGFDAVVLATPDAAFVSLLTAAQRTRRRGPRPRDAGVQLAAAAAVALAYRKVEDDLADEPGGRVRVLERWLRPKRFRARRVIETTGFDLTHVDGAFAAQVAVEAERTAPLDTLARSTGCGMAALLAHTARMAGAARNVEPLREMGAALGEMVFAVDAAADLEYDAASGLSNPLIDPRRPGRIPREEDYRAARQSADRFAGKRLALIARGFSAVRLPAHGSLVEHILTEAIPERVRSITAGGGAVVGSFRYEQTRPGRLIRAALRGPAREGRIGSARAALRPEET